MTRRGSVPIKVLAVADRAVVRAGLQAMVRGRYDIEIVGEAPTIADAAVLSHKLWADVALVDFRDPLRVDLKALTDPHPEGGRCQVILITPRTDEETILSLIMAGAIGYLFEDLEPEDLANAIRTVHDGGTLIDPWMASVVTVHLRKRIDPQVAGVVERRLHDRILAGEGHWSPLTIDEFEVLHLIVRGETNRRIGHTLHLDDKMVGERISRILRKIGAKDRGAAMAWWVRHSPARHRLSATAADADAF